MTPNQLIRNILSDMKVDLTQLFDRNFEEKGFFGNKWVERKNKDGKGTLLHVTGTMRRSIRSQVRGNGVAFTSSQPYTSLHNEGGLFFQTVRAHTRRGHSVRGHIRTMNMPQRQIVGDHTKVKQSIDNTIGNNLTDFFNQLAKKIR